MPTAKRIRRPTTKTENIQSLNQRTHKKTLTYTFLPKPFLLHCKIIRCIGD